MESHIVKIESVEPVTHDVKRFRLEKPSGYKFTPGPGYFIAGGAGITPFVAILRQLYRDNRINGNSLYFSNKTSKDIIYENEFSQMLGENAHFILTREEHPKYTKSRIQRDFLAGQSLDFSRHFYVCGPDKMVEEISGLLAEMGAASDALVFEK